MSIKLSDYAYQPPKTNPTDLSNANIASVSSGVAAFVISLGAFFEWDPASTATPDNISVICPAAITPPAPGRWLIIGVTGAGGFNGVKAIASTTYTVLAEDVGFLLHFNANSPVTLTIPTGIGSAPKGFGVIYSGSSYLSFAASGTTINGEVIVQTNQMVSAVEDATDVWQIAGNEGFESVINEAGTSRAISSSDMDSFINFTDTTGAVVNIIFGVGIAPVGAQVKILFTGSNSAYFNVVDVPGVTFIGSRQIVKNQMVSVKQISTDTWQISNGNVEAEFDYIIGFTDINTFAVNDVVYAATMTNQTLFNGQVQYPTISKITDITTQSPIGVVIAAAGTNQSITLLERGVLTFTLAAGGNVGDFVYVNNSGVLTLTKTTKPLGRILANGFSPQYSVYIDVHMAGSAAGKSISDYKTNNGAQTFDVSTYPLNIVNLTNPMPTVADFTNQTGDAQVSFASFGSSDYNAGDSLFYRNLSSTYNVVLKSAGGLTLATVPPLGAAAINVLDPSLGDGSLSIAVSGSASGSFGTAAYKQTTDNTKSSVVALNTFTNGNIYIADTNGSATDSGKNFTSVKTNLGSATYDMSLSSNHVTLANPMPTFATFDNLSAPGIIDLANFNGSGYNAGDSLFYQNLSATYSIDLKNYLGNSLGTIPPGGVSVINVINPTSSLISVAFSGSSSGAFGTAAYKATTDNTKASVVALSSFTNGNLPVFDSVGSAADSGIAATNVQLKAADSTNQLFQIFAPQSNPANFSPSTTFSNGASYPTFNFANGVDSEIQGQIELPDNYSLTNVFNIELFWYATAGTASQTVIFTIDAFIVGSSNSLDQVFGTAVTVTGTLGATNILQVIPYSANITPGGVAPSNQSLLKMRIRRTAAGGGTLAAPALLTGLKFKHPIT